MKTLSKTLILLPLMAVSAFAQAPTPTPNYDEINQAAAAQAAQVTIDKTDSFAKLIGELGDYLGNGLNPILESKLPKARDIVANDREKIKLMSCVERILVRHHGGAQAPQLAYDTLLVATDQNGWSSDANAITAAITRCEEIVSNVRRYPNRKIDKTALTQSFAQLQVTSAASKKAKDLITALGQPTIQQCQVGNIKVSAGLFFMGNAGVSKARCLWSNGKVYRFYGPLIGVGMGVGAAIVEESYVVDGEEMIKDSPLHVFSSMETQAYESVLVTGVGSLSIDDNRVEPEVRDGLAVGALFQSFMNVSGSFNFRFFNGKRHWTTLVDQLN